MRTILLVNIYMIDFKFSQAQVNPNVDLHKPMSKLEISQMYLTKGKTIYHYQREKAIINRSFRLVLEH